jgi:phosphoglycolate phosphatase
VRFDAVLFDLDGTLLDTLDDIADASNAVLLRHGFPAHPVSRYRYFVGEGAMNLIIRTLPESARTEDTVRRLYEEFRAEYAKNWNAKTRPYRGVPELLDALVERSVKIAVLSNKPDDFTQKCVGELLGAWAFNAVLGHRDGVPAKPDPNGAIDLAKTLSVSPARILYLGDSSIDMETALAAGMFPVGALWGFRTREELETSGACAVIGKPQDLLALLNDAPFGAQAGENET